MILFLRQIRQKLLAEGKVGKYILYALGEILLVVVGILIAVSIDGWNDDRIREKQERSYLERLLSENRQDIETFSTIISDLKIGMKTGVTLSSALNDPNASDSLVVLSTNTYFQYGSIIPAFSSSESTFDDLSSTGNLDLITNSQLREGIVLHYAEHHRVKERLDINNQWALPLDAPFTVDNDIMQFEPNSSFLFPERNLDEMAEELRTRKLKYISNVAAHHWINMDAIGQMKALRQKTIQLILQIEAELGVLRNQTLSDPLAAGWQGEPVCEVIQDLSDIRILKCTFPPGVGHEQHYHDRHVGYTLAGSRMQIRDATGIRIVDVKTGSSFYSEGVDWHEVLNVGGSTGVFLIVEPK